MVLHNNKWDKKAKYKYLKKHGLLPNKQEQEKPKEVKRKYIKNRPEENTSSSTSSSLSSDEEITQKNNANLNELESPNEDPYKDGIMLAKQKQEDNDIVSSGIEVSLLAKVTEKELNNRVDDLRLSDFSDDDEEEFIKYSNLTKNITHSYDLKKPAKDETLIEAINDIKSNKKKLQDLDFATLAKLDFDNIDGKKNDKKDGKNFVKFLSEQESEDLKTMIKEAEKQKLYRKIKMKMESKNSSTKSNTSDNSKLTEKMNEFLGLDSTTLEQQTKNNDILDNLLCSSVSENTKNTGLIDPSISKKPVKQISCVDDDNKILDDLLGL